MRFVKKLHWVCFLLIPIALATGFFSKEHGLDVNIYDTYYVVSCFTLSVIMSVVLGVISVFYWGVIVLCFKSHK